ncbi:MAG: helix-turn-helix domain-containing protein [Blastochloris sp.]|nr:helix-turn-helix domain-containing protein [Blastochloris sp.]
MHAASRPWSRWSSATFAPHEQFAAWAAALDDSHFGWDLTAPDRQQGYRADMEMRQFGATRLVRCVCSPCAGVRTTREIAGGTAAYFGLLLIVSGEEQIRCGSQEAIVNPASLLLWDSTQPMAFRFPRPLSKVTLFVPQEMLRARMPSVDACIGKPFSLHHGLGALVGSNLRALAGQGAHWDAEQAAVAVDTTLDLLAAWAHPQSATHQTGSRQELRGRIQGYIERSLDDPALDPAAVASACGVSVRYLHLIFRETGTTVARYIRTRRLEVCRRELRRGGRSISITELALRWGFSDVAHLSRAFKAQFGVSPRVYVDRGEGASLD